MQIKEITTDEFKALIRDTISETLQELLGDPDCRKEPKQEIKQRLSQSLKQTEAGDRGISPEEVAKKMGLTW
jgi:hypothetical protein